MADVITTGATGAKGSKGDPGPAGAQGIPGPVGSKGPQGPTGTNSYNVQCSAVKLLSPLQGVMHATNTMSETLLRIESICTEIRDVMVNVLDLQEHLHDSHWHGITHFAEEGVNVENGHIFIPPIQDESSILIIEYQNKIDKDANGLIYGYDFIIDDDDPQKPMSLKMLEELMVANEDPIPSIKFKWQDYLQTFRRT